jgi:hypothetical protein
MNSHFTVYCHSRVGIILKRTSSYSVCEINHVMFTLVRKSISLVASRERHGKKKINFCHFTGCLHDREEDCRQDSMLSLRLEIFLWWSCGSFRVCLNFRRWRKGFSDILTLPGFIKSCESISIKTQTQRFQPLPQVFIHLPRQICSARNERLSYFPSRVEFNFMPIFAA